MIRKQVIGLLVGAAIALSGVQAFAQAKKKAPVRKRAAEPALPVSLDRGLKLYEAGDFASASIELFKVTDGDAQDTEANKQKAEFWMGKTLFKLKYYAAALSFFDRIVQQGAKHAHYKETLRWMASLAKEMPDASPVVEKIGVYTQADLDSPDVAEVRDDLYFLLGKFHYQKNSFDEAKKLFAAVRPESQSVYAQAKLFEGATHVREYNAKPAVEAFKEVLRVAAESKDPAIKEFEDLATLSLARTFYSTGQFDLAAKYFDRVSMDSSHWANSLFEASWANFMLKDQGYPKALGNIHTLQAPYFENYIKPESVAEAITVKATIYFYNCLYDRAADAIANFESTYGPLAQELKKLLDTNADPQVFFEKAIEIRKGRSGLDPNVEKAARAVLADKTLGRRFAFVEELDRELKQWEDAEPAWKTTLVAQNVFTDVSLQRSLVVQDTGEQAKQRVTRLLGEIVQLLKRVIKIEYEILQGQKGSLETEMVQEQQLLASGAERQVGRILVDDEHEYWPFSGEYWRDELGYYRVKLTNRCERAASERAPAAP